MPELTPRGSAACKLFGAILTECLEFCTPVEAAKLRLAINPEHMSHEIQTLMAECIAATGAVAEINAKALTETIVHGEQFQGFKCIDFAEEDE